MAKVGIKKWRIYLLIVAVFVLLFLTFWPQLFHDEIQKLTKEEIDEHLEVKADFSDMSISIWRNFPGLTISLSDVSVVQNQHVQDTLLTSRRLSVVVNVFDYVFQKSLDINKIELEQPVIAAHIYADGTSNLHIVKHDAEHEHDTTSVSPDIHLEHFFLRDATLTFDDEVDDVHMALQNLDGELIGNFSETFFELTTDIECENASLKTEGNNWFANKAIRLDIASHIDRDKNSFRITKSKVAINHLALEVEGGIDVKDNRYGIDVRFNTSNSTLTELFSLADFFRKKIKNIETTGEMSLGGFVKGIYVPGTDTIPSFETRLAIRNGSFKMTSLKEMMEDIHFDLLVSNNRGIIDSTRIKLDSVFFRVQDRTVRGHAEIDHLSHSRVDAFLAGSLKIQELIEIYPIDGLEAEGTLDFKINVDGKYSNLTWPPALPHIDFDVHLSEGKLNYTSVPDSLTNIAFHLKGSCPQGKWEHANVSLDHLRVNISDSPVEGRLSVKDFSKPVISAYLKAALQMEDLLASYPIEGTAMRGILNTEIKIDGQYDAAQKIYPRIDGTIAVENGFLATVNYPKPLRNVHLKAVFKNATPSMETAMVNIEKFTYDLEDNEVFEVKGTIRDFTKFFYDLSIKGTTDLEKLSAIYELVDGKIQGKVFSDFTISGSLADLELNRYDRTRASGKIRLRDIYIETKSLPRPIKIPRARVRLTPEVLKLDTLHLITGRSSLWASGELHDYMAVFTRDDDNILARLTLRGDTLDFNEWKSIFTTPHEDALSLSNKPKKTSAWQVPSSIDFDLKANAAQVVYEDIVMQNVRSELQLQNGVMTINDSDFTSLDAKFSAKGRYDSRDLSKPKFDFKLQIDNLDIQKAYKEMELVRELLPVAADAEGLFSVDYFLQGELNHDMYPKTETLVGSGKMYIAEAKINGMKVFEQLSKAAKKDEMNDPHLRDFNLESEIKDNKVYVKPFKLKVSGFNTEIEGITDIDGPVNYIVRVQLLPLNMLKMPFHVTGTYDNPRVVLGKGHELPKM